MAHSYLLTSDRLRFHSEERTALGRNDRLVIILTPKLSRSVINGTMKEIALTLWIKRDGATVIKVKIKRGLFENAKGELWWTLPKETLDDIRADEPPAPGDIALPLCLGRRLEFYEQLGNVVHEMVS